MERMTVSKGQPALTIFSKAPSDGSPPFHPSTHGSESAKVGAGVKGVGTRPLRLIDTAPWKVNNVKINSCSNSQPRGMCPTLSLGSSTVPISLVEEDR